MRRVAWIAALFVAGCLTPADQMSEAQAIVDKVHAAIATGDVSGLEGLYHTSFFANVAKDVWMRYLADLAKREGGKMQAHLLAKHKDARPDGDYYMFHYRLVFAKGAFDERITVAKHVGEDKLAIAAHLLRPVKP